ncbi:hypothetical protein D3C73_1642720 [compost metagenome]
MPVVNMAASARTTPALNGSGRLTEASNSRQSTGAIKGIGKPRPKLAVRLNAVPVARRSAR